MAIKKLLAGDLIRVVGSGDLTTTDGNNAFCFRKDRIYRVNTIENTSLLPYVDVGEAEGTASASRLLYLIRRHFEIYRLEGTNFCLDDQVIIREEASNFLKGDKGRIVNLQHRPGGETTVLTDDGVKGNIDYRLLGKIEENDEESEESVRRRNATCIEDLVSVSSSRISKEDVMFALDENTEIVPDADRKRINIKLSEFSRLTDEMRMVMRYEGTTGRKWKNVYDALRKTMLYSVMGPVLSIRGVMLKYCEKKEREMNPVLKAATGLGMMACYAAACVSVDTEVLQEHYLTGALAGSLAFSLFYFGSGLRLCEEHRVNVLEPSHFEKKRRKKEREEYIKRVPPEIEERRNAVRDEIFKLVDGYRQSIKAYWKLKDLRRDTSL